MKINISEALECNTLLAARTIAQAYEIRLLRDYIDTLRSQRDYAAHALVKARAPTAQPRRRKEDWEADTSETAQMRALDIAAEIAKLGDGSQ